MSTIYREYAPTQFDCKGLGLDDRQDWLVMGLIQTRDSGPLDASNFAAALAQLGGESETVEVHRFGHWGPGWYEIILVDPDRDGEVNDIEASLENYPVLDDSDLSEREHEEYMSAWDGWGMTEFTDAIAGAFDLSWDTKYAMRDIDSQALLTWYESLVPSGDYYSDAYGFRLDTAIRDLTRADVAEFLKANRPRRGAVAA